MTSRDEYGLALLAYGDWAPTMEHRIGLVAWCWAEDSGGSNTTPGAGAKNNPLDSTEPAPGATDYNRVGVKNYPTEVVSIEAVYATLMNGRYPDIVSVLADEGGSAQSLSLCRSLKTWGTGIFPRDVPLVAGDFAHYGSIEVAGGGAPVPTPLPTTEDDMPLIVNVPDTGAFLLSGNLYSHIADEPSLHALIAAGLPSTPTSGPDQVTPAMHAVLVAASTTP